MYNYRTVSCFPSWIIILFKNELLPSFTRYEVHVSKRHNFRTSIRWRGMYFSNFFTLSIGPKCLKTVIRDVITLLPFLTLLIVNINPRFIFVRYTLQSIWRLVFKIFISTSEFLKLPSNRSLIEN